SFHRGISKGIRGGDMIEPVEVAERDFGRVERDRLAKLEALKARGIEPYAYSFDPSHSAVEALRLLHVDQEEGPTVRVAGRIVAMRPMGKSTFAHVADRSGRIQCYF